MFRKCAFDLFNILRHKCLHPIKATQQSNLTRACECIWRCVGKVLDGRRCGSSSSPPPPPLPLSPASLPSAAPPNLFTLQGVSLCLLSPCTLRSEDISPRFHSLWCLFYLVTVTVFLRLTAVW